MCPKYRNKWGNFAKSSEKRRRVIKQTSMAMLFEILWSLVKSMYHCCDLEHFNSIIFRCVSIWLEVFGINSEKYFIVYNIGAI